MTVLGRGEARGNVPGKRFADWRLVSVTRLVLAASGLLIVWLVPWEPDRWVWLTYGVLVLHTIYAASLLFVLRRQSWPDAWIQQWAHWIDVLWYSALIALSSGTSSIFFFGYFFCVSVAAFRWGFRSGFRVTVVSTLLFIVIGWLTETSGDRPNLERFLIRVVYLLTLGFMFSFRGGLELRMRERLQFLKDMSVFLDPRFGLDQALGTLLRRVRRLYDADVCLLLMRDAAAGSYGLRKVQRDDPDGPVPRVPSPDPITALLLQFPEGASVAFSMKGSSRVWKPDGEELRVVDPAGERIGDERTFASVATTLQVERFLTAPLHAPPAAGRLFVGYAQDRGRNRQDVSFLAQIAEDAGPRVQTMLLADRLASIAAQEERNKIARDLHDSVIQPYVGLRMGLHALRKKVQAGGAAASEEVDRMIELSDAAIAELRGHVSTLKEPARDSDLMAAISRFVARFEDATGTKVTVVADGPVAIDPRLAGELFQMICEGLSNVRRHTQSRTATVRLARRDRLFIVQIENEGATGVYAFLPRSIAERATALGGCVGVRGLPNGGTVVEVEVPLP